MVGAIVETVFGSLILRKGCNPLESFGPLIVDSPFVVLGERTSADAHFGRHLSRLGLKIVIATPQ